jgi:hypothetical protein
MGIDDRAPLPPQTGVVARRKGASSIEPMDRIGGNLENSDLLTFATKRERDDFQVEVTAFYRMPLRLDSSDGVASFSHTSRKMILLDEGGSAYILKQKPFYCRSREHCLAFMYVQQSAARNTEIVPKIIAGHSGEAFFSWRGEIFFLTPRIPGRVIDGSIEESVQCALALADLHGALDGLELSCAPGHPLYPITRSAEEARKFVAMMLDRSAESKSSEIFVSVAKQLYETIDGVDQNYRWQLMKSPIEEPRWNHGDPGPFNFVLSGGKVVAINDFDNVNVGRLARDVGILLLTQTGVFYKGATSSLRRPILQRLDVARLQAMWANYRDRGSYRGVGVEALPYEMALHWIELMGLGLVRGDYSVGDVIEALPFAEKIVADAKLALGMAI